jgi:hypothetical protein
MSTPSVAAASAVGTFKHKVGTRVRIWINTAKGSSSSTTPSVPSYSTAAATGGKRNQNSSSSTSNNNNNSNNSKSGEEEKVIEGTVFWVDSGLGIVVLKGVYI